MTTIGYAAVQLIPSLDGFAAAVDKEMGGLAGKGKTLGKSLGVSIAAGVRSSEADVKRAFENHSKLADRAADATDKVKVAQAGYQELVEKGVTSGQRFERAKAAVEKTTRDETRATRAATDALKDYEDAQKAVARGADNIGSGLGARLKGLAGDAASGGGEAAAGFVEGFGGPIAAIGTKAGPIGLALAAAVGLGAVAGGLLAQQVLSGMDQLQSQANVAAKLGLTPQQMKPIADASAEAYANNFGESVASNMDAARAAIQSGLLDPSSTQADVQAMVEQLSTVSDVMGEEIPATARAAQQAIRTGLAGNATQAFDLFVRAQQSGLNVSEDFLDTITEYGTQFRQLGLDGPTALGLISQAVKGGARDTDTAADALKEFAIRAIDGSKTSVEAYEAAGLSAEDYTNRIADGGDSAKQAFGEVLDAIRKIDDPVKRNTISVGLFGTKAEDLARAFGSMDLSTAVQQFGEVDGAAKRAADTMGSTAAGSLEGAKRSIEVAVDKMQQGLASAFGPELQKMADWVSAHQPEIVGFFTTVADASITAADFVLDAIGQIVQGAGQFIQPFGDIQGAVLDFQAFQAEFRGDDDVAAELREQAQAAYGWGEGLDAAGQAMRDYDPQGLRDALHGTADEMKRAADNADLLKTGITTLPDGKTVVINDTTAENIKRVQDLGYAVTTLPNGQVAISVQYTHNGAPISLDQLRAPIRTQAIPGETLPRSGRAYGGPISGPGGPKSDIIPIWASNGEHVWTAEEVAAVGGHGQVQGLRAAALAGAFGRFANGGAVGPDVAAAEALAGTPYSQDNRNDCSGMAARVIARALGLPESSLMNTKNAEEWLTAAGFQPGIGGPGQISVGWYDHGPNPNDGHMAMTLSDGTNAEAGGKNRVFTVGPGAAGADSPQFDRHMFLPTLFGEGQGGGFPGYSGGSGSGGGGGTIGIGPNGESGTYTAPDAKAVREADQKVADADQRVRQAELKIKELDADAKESQRQAAQAELDKAKREASDARADRDEVMKGTFTPGASTGGGPGGGEGKLALSSTFSGFGSAIGEFAGGQIGSALDLFGIGDSPGWLQGLSQFVGGISVSDSSGNPIVNGGSMFGGGGGGSVAPLSAQSFGAGVPPPGDAHGLRAGQAPGQVNNWTINARDTEDAFVKAQRFQQERSAARLSRY